MKNVTRIYAPSMHEALQRLGRELGDDAVILDSRELPGGVEVVAALEAEAPLRTGSGTARSGFRRHQGATPRAPAHRRRQGPPEADPEADRRGAGGAPASSGSAPSRAPAPGRRGGSGTGGGTAAGTSAGSRAPAGAPRAGGPGADGAPRDPGGPAVPRRTAHDLLAWLRGFTWAPRTVAPRSGCTVFLGPSGAGKTSLIAKLAAAHVLRHGPDRVVVLNGDAFRFGGQSQLTVLGEMLGIRCLQVHRPEDAAHMAREAGRGSLVLVDTPGLRARPGDPSLTWIGALVEELEASRCLVLPAQSQRAVVDAVLDGTEPFDVDFLTLTKLDEPGDPVETLRALRAREVPLAWLSAGDLIPDDVEPATAEGLLELLRRSVEGGTDARSAPSDGGVRRPRGLFHEQA